MINFQSSFLFPSLPLSFFLLTLSCGPCYEVSLVRASLTRAHHARMLTHDQRHVHINTRTKHTALAFASNTPHSVTKKQLYSQTNELLLLYMTDIYRNIYFYFVVYHFCCCLAVRQGSPFPRPLLVLVSGAFHARHLLLPAELSRVTVLGPGPEQTIRDHFLLPFLVSLSHTLAQHRQASEMSLCL